MKTIDNTDDFMDQIGSLEKLSGGEKLLLVELLKYEQEMETQGTEFRYKQGMNEIIDNYLTSRHE